MKATKQITITLLFLILLSPALSAQPPSSIDLTEDKQASSSDAQVTTSENSPPFEIKDYGFNEFGNAVITKAYENAENIDNPRKKRRTLRTLSREGVREWLVSAAAVKVVEDDIDPKEVLDFIESSLESETFGNADAVANAVGQMNIWEFLSNVDWEKLIDLIIKLISFLQGLSG